MFRNLRAYLHALAKQVRSLPTYLACPAGYETVPCCFCLTPFNRPAHLPTVDLCQRCERGQDESESNWVLAHLSDAQAMAAGPGWRCPRCEYDNPPGNDSCCAYCDYPCHRPEELRTGDLVLEEDCD